MVSKKKADCTRETITTQEEANKEERGWDTNQGRGGRHNYNVMCIYGNATRK